MKGPSRVTTSPLFIIVGHALNLITTTSINNGFLKLIWIGELFGMLRNSKIYIEFNSKFFIMIKNGLKIVS
jgi:hypothetical protein